MSVSVFLNKKKPGLIVLVVFALFMLIVINITPTVKLTNDVNNIIGLLNTVITDSAGSSFFLITTMLLCSMPIILKLPRERILKLWLQFAILLALSFVAKTVLKHVTEIPRPYTYQLEQLELVDSAEQFYQLDSNDRDQVVELAKQDVSQWRIDHWQGETNYSLPSGHTIFAAICVVFWGGFFSKRKKILPIAILTVWAVSVGASRIYLGMHWPTDLIASIICAGVLYCLVPEWNSTKFAELIETKLNISIINRDMNQNRVLDEK